MIICIATVSALMTTAVQASWLMVPQCFVFRVSVAWEILLSSACERVNQLYFLAPLISDSELLAHYSNLSIIGLILIVSSALQEKKKKNNKQSSHKNKSVFPII